MTTLPAPSKKTVGIILDNVPTLSSLRATEAEEQLTLDTFLAVVYATDFVIPFDWMTEFSGTKSNELADISLLNNADAGVVRKLLIANLRLDHFKSGHLEQLLHSGYLQSALKRLDVLLPTLL